MLPGLVTWLFDGFESLVGGGYYPWRAVGVMFMSGMVLAMSADNL